MSILKHCIIDPTTKKPVWKISLIPGTGGGGGQSTESACLSGTAIFSGCGSKTGTIISHKADTLKYKVFIIPSKSSQGDIGEYWVENKTPNSFVVKNTGSNKTTEFDWIVINPSVKLAEIEDKYKQDLMQLQEQVKKEIDKIKQNPSSSNTQVIEKILYSSVVLENNSNKIKFTGIGEIDSFNPKTDSLTVIKNIGVLTKDIHYKISLDNRSIESLDGDWKASKDEPVLFSFAVLKNKIISKDEIEFNNKIKEEIKKINTSLEQNIKKTKDNLDSNIKKVNDSLNNNIENAKKDIKDINKVLEQKIDSVNNSIATQYEEMTQEMTNLNSKNIQIDKNIENLQNNIPSNYVKSINGKIGDVKINLENLRSSCTTYYVDEENGSNYNNHGMSKSQAFKTLLHAVEVANMYNNGIYTSPVTIEILSNLTKKGQNTTLLSIANFTGIIDLKNHQTEFGLNIRYCNVKISNLIIENGYFFVNDSICHLNNCVFNHCADDTTGLSFQFCQVVLDSIRIEGENNTKISTISFLHSFASIRGAKISNAKYGIECLASIVVTSNDLVFTNCQSQYVTSQGGKIFHE